MTINGDPVRSGTTKTISDLTMFGGTVTILIVVTAQDGMSAKTYTVTANRNLF
ncbi:MAG: cadherin-like beta sandwich domain-containing protein [Treponema sp.]|nr:cadherin-like beta sandwich domain-containing protein [Treponema sp.]